MPKRKPLPLPEVGRSFGNVKKSIVRETLHGRTTGENARHGIVRVAFLNCLQQDDRIKELFGRWEQQTGLYAAARQVATVWGRVAQESGFESLSALLEACFTGRLPAMVKFDAPEHQREGAELLRESETAAEHLGTRAK